ncbi:DNA-binding MarR family transcriptional regulator [Deinobacterium chartae]|uniref:DNA-binding MarR family transcriptional regulator n=1 Tax=Deinobacterium chartae TaxID=521158 RepID=A0A841HWF7_9DEIO|nr:MarR family transcriptional regulator [Deinobacterium chartae]MBB6097183.1 DNA-binding MarR family transcriptional regulator [Deinobacterium chartae]
MSDHHPERAPIDQALREPPIRLWRRMIRVVHSKVRQVEEALAPLGLSMTEFDTLAVIRVHEGIAQHELAERLLFSAPNMTYHAQRLVNRGLIRRESTGKYKRMYLTPEGRELIEQALPKVIGLHQEQFSALTPEQLEQFGHLLRLLR